MTRPTNKQLLLGLLLVVCVITFYFKCYRCSKPTNADVSCEQDDMSDNQSERSEITDIGQKSEYDLYSDIQDFMNRQTSYVMQLQG